MSLEKHPKSFGTFKKQVPSLNFSGLSHRCLSRDKKKTATIVSIHSTLFLFFFVILVGEQAGEWKATSKWQETSTTCVELLQMQAILWFEGTLEDH